MTQDQIIEKINSKVIDGLKEKGLDWFRPWKAGEENQPMNRLTKSSYKGFNIFLLNCEMIENGYRSNQWLTFKQVVSMEGQVKKGSKSTEIYFWKRGIQDMKTGKFLSDKQISSINLTETFNENGRTIKRYRQTFTIRYYKVFNLDQCTGIEPLEFDSSINASFTNNEMVESIIDNYVSKQKLNFDILKSSDQAYYSPSKDRVVMPSKEFFVDIDFDIGHFRHCLDHEVGSVCCLDKVHSEGQPRARRLNIGLTGVEIS